ncbi:MAG: HIT family protein [Candidatus Dormibacteria bacterium]|jgi:ATP adenylyltransferase
MERLWSPWRGTYVTEAGSRAAGGCFFCAAVSGEDTELLVAQDAATVTLLNRFPYNPGHLMAAPRAHLPDLLAVGDDGAAALMVAARRAMRALQAAMRPDGFNLGVNQGDAAGASVEHVHLHVVPRWGGDTNFMPVVGVTKVLPESLEQSADRLRTAYAGLR